MWLSLREYTVLHVVVASTYICFAFLQPNIARFPYCFAHSSHYMTSSEFDPAFDIFANEFVVLHKNFDALQEMMDVGVALPTQQRLVLQVVDGKRNLKLIVRELDRSLGAQTQSTIRSLLRMGLIQPMPVESAEDAAQMAQIEAKLSATGRMRVIAAISDPKLLKDIAPTASNVDPHSMLRDGSLKSLTTAAPHVAGEPLQSDEVPSAANIARLLQGREIEPRNLEALKFVLIDDLRQLLGADVELVRVKIMMATRAEELMKAVVLCARVLDIAVSKEAAEKFCRALLKRLHEYSFANYPET
jgi:hypothetical protein